MCVRNGQRYVAEALDSIGRQDVPGCEIVIVDDGSTDDSARIALAHALTPTVLRQAPLGPAVALNHGIANASGEFLTFLDSDDVWPTGRLAAMLEALSADPRSDAVCGKAVNTDENLRPVAQSLASRLHTALVIRREAFHRVGLFRTDVAHAFNIDWTSRAELTGLRFSMLDRVVLYRRIHGENMGIRDRVAARHDLLRIVRDHHARNRGP
jgi:glycosyltransferase involved in cell wall biosynthesis